MKPDTREPDTREFEALREKVRVLSAVSGTHRRAKEACKVKMSRYSFNAAFQRSPSTRLDKFRAQRLGRSFLLFFFFTLVQ
jgi:hypothetical protein